MNFKRKKPTSNKQIRFVNGVPTVISNDNIEDNNNLNLKTEKTKKNKNFKCVILSIIFILFVVISPFFFDKAGIEIIQPANINTTFLKVWHIDSFEGGSGNRADFLNKIAQQYHNINPSTYVIVQTLTEEEVKQAISAGDRPDVISFSHHISNSFVEYLQPLNVKINGREDIVKYSQKNGETYAVPWYMSGYCLIGNSSVDARVLETLSADTAYSFDGGQYNYVVGLKNSYAQVAMNYNTDAKCDLNACDIGSINKTSYQAYCDFVENKASVLLGTTRDFYRIKNRISLGNMQQCKFVPLGKFTDLIQYIGVLDSKNKLQAESFIEYLTSNDIQKKLSNIGLFSPNKLKIYSDEDYKEFETKLNMDIKSISIFESEENKQKLLKESINKLV